MAGVLCFSLWVVVYVSSCLFSALLNRMIPFTCMVTMETALYKKEEHGAGLLLCQWQL